MPNRADALNWDASEDDGAAKPAGLSRDAIVAAAITLADAEGLEAVSIRRVAAELGARPMSLYSHIASKDDLVDLMLDEVMVEVLVPEPMPTDWREALRAIAQREYATFRRHLWTVKAASRPRPLGPNVHRHGDQTRRAVELLGRGKPEALAVVVAVDAYVLGYALFELTLSRRGEQDHALAGTFEPGLEIVLDGIAAGLDD